VKQNLIPQPQLGAASALVQLLTENPNLPVATWTIGEHTLHGHLHSAGFEELGRYAGVLGGSIRPVADFPLGGQAMRSHYLTSVWRDVSVEVVAVLPVAAQTAVAA